MRTESVRKQDEKGKRGIHRNNRMRTKRIDSNRKLRNRDMNALSSILRLLARELGR
jgi:hypothetical protein